MGTRIPSYPGFGHAVESSQTAWPRPGLNETFVHRASIDSEMRLLHTKRLEVVIVKDDEIPPYAILSHTWSHNDEVSLHDMESFSPNERLSFAESEQDGVRHRHPGLSKIIRAAGLARRDQYEWFVLASHLNGDCS